MIEGFRDGILKRLDECPAVAQWIKLAARRRTCNEFDGVSEKEFLLKYSNSIQKYSEFLPLENNQPLQPIQLWHGSGYFWKTVSIDHKFKLIIDRKKIHNFFANQIQEPIPPCPDQHHHPAVTLGNESDDSSISL